MKEEEGEEGEELGIQTSIHTLNHVRGYVGVGILVHGLVYYCVMRGGCSCVCCDTVNDLMAVCV